MPEITDEEAVILGRICRNLATISTAKDSQKFLELADKLAPTAPNLKTDVIAALEQEGWSFGTGIIYDIAATTIAAKLSEFAHAGKVTTQSSVIESVIELLLDGVVDRTKKPPDPEIGYECSVCGNYRAVAGTCICGRSLP